MHRTRKPPLTPDEEIQLLMNLLFDDCPISRRILELAYEQEASITHDAA